MAWALTIILLLLSLATTVYNAWVIAEQWLSARRWRRGRDHGYPGHPGLWFAGICFYVALLIGKINAPWFLVFVLVVQEGLWLPLIVLPYLWRWARWRPRTIAQVVRRWFGGPDHRPLAAVISAGDVAAVRRGLEGGADPNWVDAHGRPLLQSAVLAQMVEIARLLLQAGARVDMPDAEGRAAIGLAVEYHQPEMVRLLLEAGADPDGFTYGRPLLWGTFKLGLDPNTRGFGIPLLWGAAASGQVEVARVLLEAGVDPDRLYEGRTPLHLAVERRHRDMVALLLALGADPAKSDGRGRTPADWARTRGFTDLAALLDEARARNLAELQ